MKKLISVFLVISMCCMLCLSTTAYAKDLNQIKFKFPVTPGTAEWNELKDTSERRNKCQIPQDILNQLSTGELIDIVLQYPFILDIYAFDSPMQGFEQLIKKFNGIEELISRKDLAKNLLLKLKNFDTSKLNSTSVYDVEPFKFHILEILISRGETLQQFNIHDLKDLQEILEKKITDAKNNKDLYIPESLTERINSNLDFALTRKGEIDQCSTALLGSSSLYVTTPKGSKVPVQIDKKDMSYDDKLRLDNGLKSQYPGITFMSHATRKYNCHSYAWYMWSPSNPYWMPQPLYYMNDGSYKEFSPYGAYVNHWLDANDKVFYPGEGHSAIIQSRPANPIYESDLDKIIVYAKWGTAGLVKHKLTEGPYSTYNLEFYYLNK